MLTASGCVPRPPCDAARAPRPSRAAGRSCRAPGASRRASPRSAPPSRRRAAAPPSPSRSPPGVPSRAAISSFVGRSSSEPPASQPAQSASTTCRWNGESGRVSAGGPVWSAVVTSGSTRESGAEKTTLSAPRPIRSPCRSGTFDPAWIRLPFRNVPLKLPRSSTNQRSPSSVTTRWCRLTVGFSIVRSLSSARPTANSGRELPLASVRQDQAGPVGHGRTSTTVTCRARAATAARGRPARRAPAATSCTGP